MADNLQSAVPPSWLKHKDETDEIPDATDRSLAAFKAKVELMVQAQKAKKRASAENKKAERVAKQQSWKNATKRVQRYLGLRQASYEKQLEAARAELATSGFEWGEHNAASKNATSRYVNLSNASLPVALSLEMASKASFKNECSVISSADFGSIHCNTALKQN
jgi:hypothetical protein